MSISDTARIDALFKKFQGRTNTGVANGLAAETPGNVTGVYPSKQLYTQTVPDSEATYIANSTAYPWIKQYSIEPIPLRYDQFTSKGYKVFMGNTNIRNIIPFYTITVFINGGTELSRDQYILDFETGILIVYINASTVTITCSTYTGTLGLNPSVLTVAGGSTPAVTVDASGRVGIGLATPSVALDISGGLRTTGDISGGSRLFVTGASQLTGNVGIGRTNAARVPLDVSGAAWIAGDISGAGGLFVTGASQLAGELAVTGGSQLTGNVGIGRTNAARVPLDVSGAAWIAGDISGAGNLTITGVTRLTGNVGIGTTTPAAELDVSGSLRISGTIGIGKEPTPGSTLDISGNGRMNQLALNPGPSLIPPNNTLWINTDGNLYFGMGQIAIGSQTSGWMDTYLLGSPAAPVQVNLLQTSALILVTWQNPTQITTTFSTRSLPAINSLCVDISGVKLNGAGVATTRSLTNTSRLPGDLTTAQLPVTAFALVKGTGPDSVGSYTDGSGASRVAYAHYLGADIFADTTVDFSIWYQGATIGPGVQKLNVTGVKFLSGGGPAAPTGINGTSPTYSTAIVTFTPTTISDASNNLTAGENGAPTISTYALTLTPSGSPWRYPGVLNNTPVALNSSSSPFSVAGLYPDTSYNISVIATNSLGAAGLPGTATMLTTTNSALAPKTIGDYPNTNAVAIFGTDLCGNVTTLKHNGSTVNVTTNPLRIVDGSKQITFTTPQLALHIPVNRGSSGTTMKLQLTCNNRTPANYPANSFGASLAAQNSYTDFTIKQNTISDVSGASTSDGGFYATSAFDVTGKFSTAYSSLGADASVLAPIKIEQFFQTTRNGNFPSTAQTTTAYSVWLTTLARATAPTVTGLTAGTTTATAATICGIPIYSQYAGNITGLSATNCGAPLYVPNAISIDIPGATLSRPFDMASGSGLPAASYAYPTTSITSYQLRPNMTATVRNIHNNTGSTATGYTLPYLFDSASITTNAAQTRWNSPQAGGTFVSDSVFNNAVTTLPVYECILYNGFYTGAGSPAFVDYSTISGPNYSSGAGQGAATGGSTLKAGYRYVTFKFVSGIGGTGTPDSFKIQITFSNPPTADLTEPTSSKKGIKYNGQTIDVLYKTQVGGTQTYSAWLDANSSSTGTIASSTPRFGMNNYQDATISGNTAELKVQFPGSQSSIAPIYVTVGIPPSQGGFGVSSVSISS